MTKQQVDKSPLPNGDPYWAAIVPIYTIISETGRRQVVKLSRKRQKLLKKQKCPDCGHSKAESGWIIKHLPEHQQQMQQQQQQKQTEAENSEVQMHICPNCARGNLVRVEW